MTNLKTSNASVGSQPRMKQTNDGNRHTLCWQQNLQHCTTGTSEMAKDMTSEGSKKQMICLIQEPYVGKKGLVGYPRGINRYFCRNSEARAAILSMNIDLWLCPSFSGRDVTTCIWNTAEQGEIYLVSVYMDGTVQRIPKQLIDLMESGGDKKIIVGADTNAHSTLWGYDRSTARGDLLEEFIFQYDLTCLNNGNTPTFKTCRAESIIDITLVTANLLSSVTEWKVDTTNHFSDHRRLMFKIGAAQAPGPKGWKVRNVEWGPFEQNIEKLSKEWDCPAEWDEHTVDQETQKLKKDLNVSLSKVARRGPQGGGKDRNQMVGTRTRSPTKDISTCDKLAICTT